MQESKSTARWMKSMETLAARPLFWAIVLAVLTFVAATAIAPFYLRYRSIAPGPDSRTGMIGSHDMANHLAVLDEFYKSLESGVAYPRWLAGSNYGYGLPWTNFYPPGFYYLGSAAYALTGDWGDALLIVSIIMFIASGLAFYLLARAFLSKLVSAIAALIYMMFPYHMIDLYWRGAMAELLGFIFIPLIMYFAYRVGTKSRAHHYAGLGLCYGLYMMSHLPVGYMFSYALLLYAVAWAVMSKDARIALRIATGMIIGAALSAIYWLPAVLEGKYSAEEVSKLMPYKWSFITLTEVEPDNYFEQIMHWQFMLLVLTLIALIVFLSEASRQASVSAEADFISSAEIEAEARQPAQMRLWVVLAVGATFMSTSLSTYVSKLIPRIQASTPAWRWLTIACVFTCLLAGLALERMRGNTAMPTRRLKIWRRTIIAALALNFAFTTGLVIFTARFQGRQWDIPNLALLTFSPKDATRPENMPDTPLVVIEPGGDDEWSKVDAWDPQYRCIRLRVTQPSQVRLRTYHYPGWIARVDGQDAPMSKDTDGAQMISVPPGEHTLETHFVNTLPRAAGTVSSGLTLLLIIGLAGADYFRSRRIKTSATSNSKTA